MEDLELTTATVNQKGLESSLSWRVTHAFWFWKGRKWRVLWKRWLVNLSQYVQLSLSMCNVHQHFMKEWAINNGKTVAKFLLWHRRLPNTNQAHFRWTCIRLKNKLVRNYSFMGQVRTGKRQLTLAVIWVMTWPDKTCRFWEPLAQDAINVSWSIRKMMWNCFYL